MNPQELLVILHTAERLKNTPRHSWTSSGRQESVAEHSFRLAAMAYFMKDEFPALDIDRVIMMCLFHDFGEAFTGDIPAFVKNESDSEREAHLINDWLSALPSPYREELSALFTEMEAQETAEARLYRTLDKLEALIQHDEADIATWLPLEYELQFTYGTKESAAFPYTKLLREEIDRITREKIENQGS
jgi:predicted hydrolases of HD superfamily